MGFKIQGSQNYINAEDMSANITGDPVNLASHLGAAFQCIITGAPTGVLKLQASCDPTSNAANVVNWTDVSIEVDITAAGTKIFNCRNIYYKWIRVVYEATAGAGNLTVNYTLKGEW